MKKMRISTGYLLAAFVLGAHTESNTLDPITWAVLGFCTYIFLDYGVRGTEEIKAEFKEVKGKLKDLEGRLEEIKEQEQKNQQELLDLINEKDDGVRAKLEEQKLEISKNLKEQRLAISGQIEQLEEKLERADVARNAQWLQIVSNEREANDREFGLLRVEIQGFKSVFSKKQDEQHAVIQCRLNQIDEKVHKMSDQVTEQVQGQLQVHHANIQTIVTEQLATNQQVIEGQFEHYTQIQTKAFEQLHQEFTKNLGVSEDKMREMVTQSEHVLSDQFKSLQDQIDILNRRVQEAQEEDKIWFISQISALQHNFTQHVNNHFSAFEIWKNDCNRRFGLIEQGQVKIEIAQKATAETLNLHSSWILQMRQENEQLKQTVQQQNKQLKKQKEQLRELVGLVKENLAATRQNQAMHTQSLEIQTQTLGIAQQVTGQSSQPRLGHKLLTEMSESRDFYGSGLGDNDWDAFPAAFNGGPSKFGSLPRLTGREANQ